MQQRRHEHWGRQKVAASAPSSAAAAASPSSSFLLIFCLAVVLQRAGEATAAPAQALFASQGGGLGFENGSGRGQPPSTGGGGAEWGELALFPEDYFLHPGGTSSASTANSFPPMEETGELSNYGRGLRQAPAVTAPKHEVAEPEEYPISATALGLVKRDVSPAAARKKWRSRRWPKRNLYKNSRFGKKRKRVGMLAKMGLLGGGTGQTTEEKLAQISNAITMWEAKLMKFAEKFSDAPSVLNENPTWLRLLKVRDTLRQMLAKAELQALDQTRM